MTTAPNYGSFDNILTICATDFNNNMTKHKQPDVEDCLITFPTSQILLVTINRPKKMNSIPKSCHWSLDALWKWYDGNPSLRCAIITGAGTKAFCAGSDLIEIEQAEDLKRREPGSSDRAKFEHPPTGFAGLSRRRGRKPIVAAVNGLALGGGFEIVLNCDIVIASPSSQYGLPEPLVGVYASGGGLPRLIRAVGLAAASDIALTGRRVSAKEAFELKLVSRSARSAETVLDEAIEVAKQIASISPDGIIITRHGLREAWETASVERAYQITHEQLNDQLTATENHAEGLAAFREKRKPRWKDAKL